MGKEKFYTKGDRESILKRVNQVHTITIFCPLQDRGVQDLKYYFQLLLSEYRISESGWYDVPAIDALRCFLFTKSMNQNGVDMSIIEIIAATLKIFMRLKYITFEFVNDEAIYNSYYGMLNNNKKEIKNNIYRVNTIEFNLSDMFSQEIIDQFNKILVMDEIIPNSYLDRSFRINFTYDEYISFMDMFLGNYGPALHQMDRNICDYFRSFPSLIDEHKPDIRVITNYSEL